MGRMKEINMFLEEGKTIKEISKLMDIPVSVLRLVLDKSMMIWDDWEKRVQDNGEKLDAVHE